MKYYVTCITAQSKRIVGVGAGGSIPSAGAGYSIYELTEAQYNGLCGGKGSFCSDCSRPIHWMVWNTGTSSIDEWPVFRIRVDAKIIEL